MRTINELLTRYELGHITFSQASTLIRVYFEQLVPATLARKQEAQPRECEL